MSFVVASGATARELHLLASAIDDDDDGAVDNIFIFDAA